MKTKSFNDMACSIAAAVEQAGDKWSVLILRDLTLGLARFDQLETSLGISTNTLSARLKSLEGHGMIERFPYQDRPVRHAYRLTEKGRAYAMVLAAMLQWGDRWGRDDGSLPPMKLVDESGAPVNVRLVSKSSGEVVSSAQTVPGPGADDKVRWRFAQSRTSLGDPSTT